MTCVVVVGSLNSDIVVTAPRHPAPGETVLGDGVATFRGGKGANQAVAAARAGAAVRMVGRVGADAAGVTLTDGLRADGIDVTQVGVCKHDPSGTALIVVASNGGENSIVVVPGANAKLRPVHVDDASAAGVFRSDGGTGVLLTQLEIPLETVARALELGRAEGLTTILNAAPANAAVRTLLAAVDVLVVNEHELALAAGNRLADDDADGRGDDDTESRGDDDTDGHGDLDAGVATILAIVPAVIVTLGSQGVLVADRHGVERIAAHQVEVLDTTGAGDAFCGVLAASLAAGLDLRQAAIRANAAGALATTKAGAQPSAPTAAAVDALLGSGA